MIDATLQTTRYDFERAIKSHGLEKLVVCQSQYDYFIDMGCSPELLHLSKPLPVDMPVPQPKDWYRKHGKSIYNEYSSAHRIKKP